MSWKATEIIKDLKKVCKKKVGANHQPGVKYPRKQRRGALIDCGTVYQITKYCRGDIFLVEGSHKKFLEHVSV